MSTHVWCSSEFRPASRDDKVVRSVREEYKMTSYARRKVEEEDGAEEKDVANEKVNNIK